MPIRQMCEKDHPGAYKLEPHHYGDTEIWMVDTHHGLVLEDRERNGYDDSDFYAVVWDEEAGEPRDVNYGTTRFWTYPNHAEVDAPPEIRAKYDAYLERLRIWRLRNTAHAAALRTAELMDTAGLTARQVLDLEDAFNPAAYATVWQLLVSYHRNRLRSPFRKSLAEQIRSWAVTPKAERRYDSPLSPRQRQYL